MLDPAEEFDAIRGDLNRKRIPVSRNERPTRRHSYNTLEFGVIPRASAFDDDPLLCSPIHLIPELRQHECTALLREAVRSQLDCGRKRWDGDWPALYLFYVQTGERSMRRFHRVWGPIAFPVCGFGSWIPSYQELYHRFIELERCWTAFADAVELLIQQALKYEPRISQVIMADSTHALSAASIEHACTEADNCKGDRPGHRSPFATDKPEEVARARSEESEYEPADDTARYAGTLTRRGIETYTNPSGRVMHYRLVFADDHWGRSLDLISGFRRYNTRKSWFGTLVPALITPVVGLPLCVEPMPADIQEWDAYPRLFERVCRILGRPPLAVTGDRGFGLRDFYEFNIRRGVAVVGPRRKRGKIETHLDWRDKRGRWDEDGVPRCPICGGEGRQDGAGLGLYFDEAGNPRIRFVCATPYGPRCRKVWSIACAEEWADLIALSRVNPLYWDLRHGHHNLEGVFDHARDRHRVDGKDVSSRLLRAGVPAHRLRRWSSLLLDWFRVDLRHGWITSHGLDVTPNDPTLARHSTIQDARSGAITAAGKGSEWYARRIAERRDNGTHLPYGPAWEQFNTEEAA
jgi:hypothetical protein